MDYPLCHYRLPPWLIYRTRSSDGLLYWSLSTWDYAKSRDPWTESTTYWDYLGGGYNGEGSLLYPGMDAGISGCVPGMRLKTIRDSLEDYEYFLLAERAGLGARARDLVSRVARDWKDWDADPLEIEKARVELGALIDADARVATE